MRCRCCDSPDTRLWKGDYYCSECASVVRQTMREDFDTHGERHGTGYQWSDDTALIHAHWDDDQPSAHPPVTLAKMKEKDDD